MLIEDIVEDEVALWTEGSISWIYVNRGYYQGNMVQFVDGAFHPCVGVLLGAAYLPAGYRRFSIVWLLFRVF